MLSAVSEAKPYLSIKRSFWPGLAASLGFRPEDRESETTRGWICLERSMALRIFLWIRCGVVISGMCGVVSVGELMNVEEAIAQLTQTH